MRAWSALRCFCSGGTNRVQPYWKFATATIPRMLKRRTTQRLDSLGSDATGAVGSAIDTPPQVSGQTSRFTRKLPAPLLPATDSAEVCDRLYPVCNLFRRGIGLHIFPEWDHPGN